MLQNAVISESGGRAEAPGGPLADGVVPENSKAYDHPSNGRAEQGVQELEGIVRTLKDSLECKLGIMFNFDHPIVHWMVEHAATIINRFSVSRDGKTPYERIKGRKSHVKLVPFGESIMYKVQASYIRCPRWNQDGQKACSLALMAVPMRS